MYLLTKNGNEVLEVLSNEKLMVYNETQRLSVSTYNPVDITLQLWEKDLIFSSMDINQYIMKM